MRVTLTPSALDLLWRPHAVMSVILIGEGLALVLALAPGTVGDRGVYFGLASLMIQWVALLTVGGLYLLRRLLAGKPAHSVAWVALALLLASTWLVGATAWFVLFSAWSQGTINAQVFMLRLTGLALTVGLLGLAAFQNHWRARQLAVQAKQFELEALQARIHPHFLFNTLNTGAALVHARPEEAERLLLDLADLFRAALSGERDIELVDELSLARRYLEIESLRFGARLQVNWELPANLPPIRLPALSIQPLVENAIRHGIEPSPTGGAVDILVRAEAGWLTVSVCNDLPGNGREAVVGHQLGLASVRDRILAFSHGRGKLDTRTESGRYFAVISLPIPAGA